MTHLNETLVCWLVLWFYWVFRYRGNKKTVYRQSRLTRAFNSFAVISSYVLVYAPLSVGWLGLRVFPGNNAVQTAGVVFCALGVMLAIWARRTIGTNWSGIITLKQDHELIQSGPYRLVRHPIYTGLILAILGAAIVLGELRGLIGVALMTFSFTRKMNEEERLMNAQFPNEYPAYQARVKRLVPFIY